MASITRHGNGWRAQVARRGERRSRVFATKREAQDWAARQEHLIMNASVIAADQVFGALLDRYAQEVSPTKRGERWEVVRLKRLRRDDLAKVRLSALTPQHIADWRDRRLLDVAPVSVNRELSLLSAVCEIARREWGLLQSNPVRDVRRPPDPQPRNRLPTDDEMKRLAFVAGPDLTRSGARAFHAFRFGCETAMRAGEICGLTWERIDLKTRVAHLPMTKNGHSRDVPLTRAAVDLLQELPRMEPVFGMTAGRLDANWRKLRAAAAVEDLHFHDSRAAALTKLSRKVDVMTLAKISGHRDLSILLNVYYRENAASIAQRLDAV
ncbi:integrase [Rhodovulum viride]|uniref:Integrase n=1 Tax=Rhodovulum viride TaxID=1231134 RepID=A0ABX9DKC0_9RHOB|nr:integrase [Rhodovulum viride]